MNAAREFPEWVVGQRAIAVVGVEGILEAEDDETVTIAGHVLPRRISPTVRYLSMGFPRDEECDHDDVDPDAVVLEAEEAQAKVDEFVGIARTDHDDNHTGALRYCPSAVCQYVSEVQP